MLAGAKLFLSSAVGTNNDFKNAVRYPMELISDTMNEIRLLSARNAVPIKNMELREMIQSLIDNLDKNTGIKTAFEYEVSGQCFDDDLKLNVYRIIQEQSSNIIKHAGAENITILIKYAYEMLQITIADDGNGFNVNRKHKGIGLSNIQNRIDSFNGEFVIESANGNGCVLNIKIPVTKRQNSCNSF